MRNATTVACPPQLPDEFYKVPPSVPDSIPTPPLILVRGGGTEIALSAFTYCWSDEEHGLCADGIPSDDLPDIGSPTEVEVEFEVPGFEFTATFVSAHDDSRCARRQQVALQRTSPTTFRLDPIGEAGDYVVHLFGRSGEDSPSKGDLAAAFLWHIGDNEIVATSLATMPDTTEQGRPQC